MDRTITEGGERMTGKPYITARQTDGQYRKIECEDYDDAYDKLSFMMSHNDRWSEINFVGKYGDEPYRKTIYRDPKDIIEEIAGWDAKEEEE